MFNTLKWIPKTCSSFLSICKSWARQPAVANDPTYEIERKFFSTSLLAVQRPVENFNPVSEDTVSPGLDLISASSAELPSQASLRTWERLHFSFSWLGEDNCQQHLARKLKKKKTKKKTIWSRNRVRTYRVFASFDHLSFKVKIKWSYAQLKPCPDVCSPQVFPRKKDARALIVSDSHQRDLCDLILFSYSDSLAAVINISDVHFFSYLTCQEEAALLSSLKRYNLIIYALSASQNVFFFPGLLG